MSDKNVLKDISQRIGDKEVVEGVGVLLCPDSDRMVSYVLEANHCFSVVSLSVLVRIIQFIGVQPKKFTISVN